MKILVKKYSNTLAVVMACVGEADVSTSGLRCSMVFALHFTKNTDQHSFFHSYFLNLKSLHLLGVFNFILLSSNNCFVINVKPFSFCVYRIVGNIKIICI